MELAGRPRSHGRWTDRRALLEPERSDPRDYLMLTAELPGMRRADVHGSRSLCVFETAHTNAAMRRFMERQLTPYAEWTDFHYQSDKRLRSSPVSVDTPRLR